jgi:hypothetical protein
MTHAYISEINNELAGMKSLIYCNGEIRRTLIPVGEYDVDPAEWDDVPTVRTKCERPSKQQQPTAEEA